MESLEQNGEEIAFNRMANHDMYPEKLIIDKNNRENSDIMNLSK